jgi:1-acylglycerone phosphate reductase
MPAAKRGASALAAAAAASPPTAAPSPPHNHDHDHDDTVVLITGCSEGGIGHALARELSGRPGVLVVATARRMDAMSSLLLEEQGGSNQNKKIRLLPLDVADASSVAACRAAVDALTGGRGIDVLINNAGATLQGALLDVPVDAARRVFDVNVLGTLSATQAFVPGMVARGGGGLVVNLGSAAGYASLPLKAVYSATKHSVRVLSDALRVELFPLGVRVMLVAPGYVRTAIDVRSREQGGWFSPCYGLSAYALYDKARGILTSSIFDEGGLGGGKSLPADVFARQLSDRVLAELAGARRAAGHGLVLIPGGGGLAAAAAACGKKKKKAGVAVGGPGGGAKRAGKQPVGAAFRRRFWWGGGVAEGDGGDENGELTQLNDTDDDDSCRAPLELAGVPTSAAARARLAGPPNLLDLVLSPSTWLPSALGGPTRHLRLGPCATSAWLSGSLLPLWLSDLIFGLKMGLWEMKAGGGGGDGAAVVTMAAAAAKRARKVK